VNWYQKGKTNLDLTEARDSEWQWHQLGHKMKTKKLKPHLVIFYDLWSGNEMGLLSKK